MKLIGSKPRGSGRLPSEKDKATGSRSGSIVLTRVEIELLLKACAKYRYGLPAYLKSKQLEIDTLDGIVAKLAQQTL